MSTHAQITANQKNATRSTGPRTPEGKAISSQNAVRHGLAAGFRLLPGEDTAAYEQLMQSYEDEFDPQSDHEAFLVTQLVQSRWKIDRIDRLQSEAFDQMLATGTDATSTDAKILHGLNTSTLFDRLERYRAAAERTYHRAHRELTQLRRQHQAAVRHRLDQLLNAPLPDEPNYPAYQSLLRNEANSSLPNCPEFQPRGTNSPAPAY